MVRGFTNNTVFPQAGGISLNAPEGWQGSVLMDTRPSSWSETGPLNGPIQLDKGRDIRGPLNLAVALMRTLDNKREQRVIVVGDGDFLANTYLPNGGNLELGMSLTNWLSQDDAFVNIPVKTARDRSLEAWREKRRDEDVLECRDIDILAQMPVSVEDTLATLRRVLPSVVK